MGMTQTVEPRPTCQYMEMISRAPVIRWRECGRPATGYAECGRYRVHACDGHKI